MFYEQYLKSKCWEDTGPVQFGVTSVQQNKSSTTISMTFCLELCSHNIYNNRIKHLEWKCPLIYWTHFTSIQHIWSELRLFLFIVQHKLIDLTLNLSWLCLSSWQKIQNCNKNWTLDFSTYHQYILWVAFLGRSVPSSFSPLLPVSVSALPVASLRSRLLALLPKTSYLHFQYPKMQTKSSSDKGN